MGCHGITLSKGQQSQVPLGLIRNARGSCVEHDLGDLGDRERLSFVTSVDLQLPECHDSGSVDRAEYTMRVCHV